MGERKVLNKYYPPDFDPSKLPRGKRPKNDQYKVRMMLPMSVCCNTCGEYLYKGKKFNSRKETVEGEDYLGIKIFRFYLKCTRCASEFTIKTDPKNSDYACEFGASRNFEPWRDKEKVEQEAKEQREAEEEGDAMKALENRTLDSKQEMDILDALDELKTLNARHAQVDTEKLLAAQKERRKQLDFDAEIEKEVNSVTFRSSQPHIPNRTTKTPSLAFANKRKAEVDAPGQRYPSSKPKPTVVSVIVKKKAQENEKTKSDTEPKSTNALSSLLSY